MKAISNGCGRVYQKNCRQMCDLLDDLLPDVSHTTPEVRGCHRTHKKSCDLLPDVSHTTPEGGMFMLATMPEGKDSMGLFSFRLNFSAATEEKIEEGMSQLKQAYQHCGTI